VKIKAQALLYAAKWLEETHGQAVLARVLRECQPAVRESYIEAIAINWHPLEEYIDFLTVSERIVGTGDGKIAEEMGEAAARANLRGVVLKVVQYIAKPDFLMRRIASLWRQFNEKGDFVLISADERAVRFEIAGLPEVYPLLCASIVGWSRAVATAIGVEAPIARHTSCRARGGAKCLFEVRSMKGQLVPLVGSS